MALITELWNKGGWDLCLRPDIATLPDGRDECNKLFFDGLNTLTHNQAMVCAGGCGAAVTIFPPHVTICSIHRMRDPLPTCDHYVVALVCQKESLCAKKSSAIVNERFDEVKKTLKAEGVKNWFKCSRCGVVQPPNQQRFQKCSRCQSVHYCSEACQRQDWAKHKDVCFVKPQE